MVRADLVRGDDVSETYEQTSPTADGGVVSPPRALDADGDGRGDYLTAEVEESPRTALQAIPKSVRLTLYVLYAVGGVVLIYLEAKGIVGADELALWAGIGSVFGVTAAGNVATR